VPLMQTECDAIPLLEGRPVQTSPSDLMTVGLLLLFDYE
jgi:hypothetical protein